MEKQITATENPTPKNNPTGQKIVNIVAYIFFAVIGVLIVSMIATEVSAKDEVYTPASPAAQLKYDGWIAQGCVIEKILAQANLMDVAHGIKIDKNLNSLQVKANRDCSGTQELAPAF